MTPAFEDAEDVAPTALVQLDRLPERVSDPIGGIGFLRIAQLLGDHRREQADVLLVEHKDGRTLRLQLDVLAQIGQQIQLAAAQLFQHLAAVGAVDHVPFFGHSAALNRHVQQRAARDGPLQPIPQGRLAARRRRPPVSRRQPVQQPAIPQELVQPGVAQRAALAADQPEQVQDDLQLGQVIDQRQQLAEELVGDRRRRQLAGRKA